jgi:hypothetical protein
VLVSPLGIPLDSMIVKLEPLAMGSVHQGPLIVLARRPSFTTNQFEPLDSDIALTLEVHHTLSSGTVSAPHGCRLPCWFLSA